MDANILAPARPPLRASATARTDRWTRRLALAPERTLAVALGVIASCALFVSVGAFRWWLVLPVGAALGWVLSRIVSPRIVVSKQSARAAAVLLLLVVVWVVLNAMMSAEYLIVSRDPGFLTLSGVWLTDHPSTDIPTLGAVAAREAYLPLFIDAPEAWNLRGDMIQPQGAKLLPAVLAVGGWLAGVHGVLVTNVLVGALGIVALYVLARSVLGPWTALAPAIGLGLTVAHQALSRAAYSEPLTLALFVMGVHWAWRGVRERSTVLLALGAVTTGLTGFARIDGAIYGVGLAGGVVLALWWATDAPRGWRARAAVTFVVTQAAVIGAGYAALWRWSQEYVQRLGPETTMLTAGYAAAIGTLLAMSCALWIPKVARAPLALRRASRWWARGAAAAIVAVFVMLVTRPWWWFAPGFTDDEFHIDVVAYFQRASGLPIDGTRSYDETTLAWVSYYLTWPLIALAVAGLAVAAYRAMRGDAGLALVAAAVLAPSLLYLLKPSIVPDQLWAIRRLHPATLPGLLFFAAVAVHAWWRAVARSASTAHRSAAVVGFAAVALLPVTGWISIKPHDASVVEPTTALTVREQQGALAQITDLCEVIDGRPVVLVGTSSHFGTLRVMCDVPVVLALTVLDPPELAAIGAVWDVAPVVLPHSPDRVPWESVAPLPVVSARVINTSYALLGLPRDVFYRDDTWYAGAVGADGLVIPIAPVELESTQVEP